jgi:hypothetical protein
MPAGYTLSASTLRRHRRQIKTPWRSTCTTGKVTTHGKTDAEKGR